MWRVPSTRSKRPICFNHSATTATLGEPKLLIKYHKKHAYLWCDQEPKNIFAHLQPWSATCVTHLPWAELISHVRSSHLPTSSSGPLSASVSISVWLMHLRLLDGTQTYFMRAASSGDDCPSHRTTHIGHLGSHRIWNPTIVNLCVKTCRPWIHLNLNLVVQPLLYLLYYGYLIWGPGFHEECEL